MAKAEKREASLQTRLAVIGAVAALVGGLIGAGATTLVAGQQIKAQREALAVGAEQNQEEFLRAERREAYAQAMTALERHVVAALDLVDQVHLVTTSEEMKSRADEVRQKGVALEEVLAGLLIVGTKGIASLARELQSEKQALDHAVQRVIDVRIRNKLAPFERARERALEIEPRLRDLTQRLLSQMRADLGADLR